MENTFASLPISEAIIKATEELGFTQMTEIQQKAIPVMLAGKDLIAKAPTGTGKTCAFGIPVIEHIDPDLPQIQAIVLAPTRELATQICDDIRNLTHFLPQIKTVVVYGGQSMERQKQQLRKNPQILIATPGRLLDLMQHRALSLQAVSTAVLDEADKMLDMGFYKDVRKILDSLKNLKQMCMFSATISREVMDIGWLYQRDQEEITVLPVQESEPKIDQYSIQCIGREKIEIILRLMKQFEVTRAIVFCNTKYTTGMVAEQLYASGLNTACLHGDMRQSERNKIMEEYKSGAIDILVATDVAARGIDVSDIQVVFNYDITPDNDSYLHRIGRTGRAKKEGISFVLHSKDEQKRLDSIIHYTHSNIIPLEMDDARFPQQTAGIHRDHRAGPCLSLAPCLGFLPSLERRYRSDGGNGLQDLRKDHRRVGRAEIALSPLPSADGGASRSLSR